MQFQYIAHLAASWLCHCLNPSTRQSYELHACKLLRYSYSPTHYVRISLPVTQIRPDYRLITSGGERKGGICPNIVWSETNGFTVCLSHSLSAHYSSFEFLLLFSVSSSGVIRCFQLNLRHDTFHLFTNVYLRGFCYCLAPLPR